MAGFNDDFMAQMRAAFREEAEDLLGELDAGLLELEAAPGNRDLIARIFRAIHTIKGSGATAGFAKLAAFTHRVEEVFEDARQEKLRVTSDLTDVALKACDVIRVLVGQNESDPVPAEAAMITSQLERFRKHSEVPVQNPVEARPGSAANGALRFRIIFRPKPEIFFSGCDPVSLLDELNGLGRCTVRLKDDAIPAFADLDPELNHLAWEVELISRQSVDVVREVFVFVEDDCELQIEEEPCDEALLVDNSMAFPSAALSAFLEVGRSHLGALEEAFLQIDAGQHDRIGEFVTAARTVANGAEQLLNEREIPIPATHPVAALHDLSRAAASFAEGFSDQGEKACIQENIEVLFGITDTLKRHYTALVAGDVFSVGNPSWLQRLEQPGGASQAVPVKGSPEQEQLEVYLDAASQCADAMNGALGRLADKDAEALPVLMRALSTFCAISSNAGQTSEAALVQPLIDNLREILEEGRSMEENELQAIETGVAEIRSRVEALRAKTLSASQPRPEQRQEGETGGIHPDKTAAAVSSIRVDQDKLERLMRVVGELLVARGMFPILARKVEAESGHTMLAKEVRDAGATISRLAEELQDSVMGIRMLPIKTVFQKLPRMVRDLARSLGKQVEFSLSGDETELDKAVIEQIGDPLVHLIRNAVDHGVEAPDDRLAKGKETTGLIEVAAFNQASSVVIQIRDDGKGLDPAMLKRKAVEKGVITDAQASSMSDQEAMELIFAPGFSTASQVTDVSGRGVGMDVVRNNIRNLQGTVSIQSAVGKGTTFTIKLPTSLMISKGILVSSSGQEYILPIEHVRDLVRIPSATVRSFRGGRFAHIRERILPIAPLEAMLGEESEARTQEELCVAVMNAAGRDFGVVVDKFHDEVESIIKPLPAELSELPGLLGATIMGDGRIVLVVNPEQLAA